MARPQNYYAAWKIAICMDTGLKMHRIKPEAEVPNLSRWTAPTTMRYRKTKTKNIILRLPTKLPWGRGQSGMLCTGMQAASYREGMEIQQTGKTVQRACTSAMHRQADTV